MIQTVGVVNPEGTVPSLKTRTIKRVLCICPLAPNAKYPTLSQIVLLPLYLLIQSRPVDRATESWWVLIS